MGWKQLITTEHTGAFATTGSNIFIGDQEIQGVVTASKILISSSGDNQLEIQGSGSLNPLVKISGSQGELFTINDNNSGSLLSVNSSSGEPIFEVYSDQTVRFGSTDLPIFFTSKLSSIDTGVTLIYELVSSSFDGAFIEYTIKSGSNARSGNIMSIWDSNGNLNFTEVSTTDIGDTSNFAFSMSLSESYIQVSGSASSNSWTVKTFIKHL